MTRNISRALPALALAGALLFGTAGCKKSVETSSTTSLGSTTTETTSTSPGAGAAPAPAEATSPGAPGAVRLVDVTLGNSLKADKTVQNATETFSPKDTIFAAVRTEGSGTATIEAKWMYKDNQVVKTDSRTINPTGPAVTEFSIQKPEGWKAGDYRVEISVSGVPTGVSKAFKVI